MSKDLVLSNGVTGRLIMPSVGSDGVIGGPVKVRSVGTVGVNLQNVRRQSVGRAIRVGAVGEAR